MVMVREKIEALRHRMTRALMLSRKQEDGLKKRGLVDSAGMIQKSSSEKTEGKFIKKSRRS